MEKFYNLAVKSQGGEYLESPRPEAAPAALVTAQKGSEKRQGWITDGGLMQPFQTLTLTDDQVLVMANPEPKRFSSDITVYVKDGGDKRQMVEVNKPLSLGPWMIYQHSYDDRLGRMSRNSGFEAVYDAWWPMAKLGLWMMAAGALMLIWGGRFGKRLNKAGETGREGGAAKQ